MPSTSYLSARTHESRHIAIRHLLDTIGEVGSVTETRSFSGLLLMMKLELPRRELHDLPTRLDAIRVKLEPSSIEALHDLETKPYEDVDVVLDVTFVDGDPDLKDVVPMVPG